MQVLDGYAAALVAVREANAARTFAASPALEAQVAVTCEDVKSHGDEAVLRSARQFDCPSLTLEGLRVTPLEIETAWRQLPARAQVALRNAAEHIENFHRLQPTGDWCTTTAGGTFLGQRYTPIRRVGMYAPNGRAAYPSTVLMLAMPARVAGVKELVLATPASKDGGAHPVILAAAYVAGITEIYKMGGAAAVAALAYGTPTVAPVDKIVGPGSIHLTLAKKHLYGIVGIDGLYGPSEVVVLADRQNDPAHLAPQLAADLVAQAEHGTDSFVCFISPSQALCNAVMKEIMAQASASPRGAIVRESLEKALICKVSSMDEACALANAVAAEHVEIWARDAQYWSSKIPDAGAIFLNTPVPLGDYLAGPSHTLPTGATARFASGVGVDTFLKRTSLIGASREALRPLAEDLEVIALLEELPGHAAAIQRAAAA